VLRHLALLEVTNETARRKHCPIAQVRKISTPIFEGVFTSTKTSDEFLEDYFVSISKV
jgi:hypothetical protein